MHLKGYIQAFKENSFTIPVYGDGDFYYYHSLDENFKIIEFYKTEITDSYFKKIYLSNIFEIDSIGAIIFVGDESYISFNQADKNIDEIINYLNDTTISSKYLNIKKEALELRQILFGKISSEEIFVLSQDDGLKSIEIKNSSTYYDFDNIKTSRMYTLEEYMQEEKYLMSNNQVNNFKENIIKKYLEKSIFDKNLFDTNKEVVYSLFIKFLNNNKSMFEQILFDSNISKGFISYLSSENEVMISPLEITIEQTLKARADQRRNLMKSFNYCFDNSPSCINEFTNVPAYKRAGIELNENSMKFSKIIISVETKDYKNEQTDSNKSSTETIKVNY